MADPVHPFFTRRMAAMYLIGAFFAVAIGYLLWKATSQRTVAWVAFAIAGVAFALGLFGLFRRAAPEEPPRL